MEKAGPRSTSLIQTGSASMRAAGASPLLVNGAFAARCLAAGKAEAVIGAMLALAEASRPRSGQPVRRMARARPTPGGYLGGNEDKATVQ
jgi:hypothetical protein